MFSRKKRKKKPHTKKPHKKQQLRTVGLCHFILYSSESIKFLAKEQCTLRVDLRKCLVHWLRSSYERSALCLWHTPFLVTSDNTRKKATNSLSPQRNPLLRQLKLNKMYPSSFKFYATFGAPILTFLAFLVIMNQGICPFHIARRN